MRDEVMQAARTTWAAKDLPARLDVAQTAKLLGFAAHDIQVLMAAGRLEALGDPAPNAPKWFAAVEIIQRANDQEWLHRATRDVARYWRSKRERSRTSVSAPCSAAFLRTRPTTPDKSGLVPSARTNGPGVSV